MIPIELQPYKPGYRRISGRIGHPQRRDIATRQQALSGGAGSTQLSVITGDRPANPDITHPFGPHIGLQGPPVLRVLIGADPGQLSSKLCASAVYGLRHGLNIELDSLRAAMRLIQLGDQAQPSGWLAVIPVHCSYVWRSYVVNVYRRGTLRSEHVACRIHSPQHKPVGPIGYPTRIQAKARSVRPA